MAPYRAVAVSSRLAGGRPGVWGCAAVSCALVCCTAPALPPWPGMLTLRRSPMAGPTCFTPPTQTSPAPASRARPSGEAAPAARCCLIPALLPSAGAALQPPNHCPSHCAVFCIVHCITAGMSKSTRRRDPPLAPTDGQAGVLHAQGAAALHPGLRHPPCCARRPAHCAAHCTHPAGGQGRALAAPLA